MEKSTCANPSPTPPPTPHTPTKEKKNSTEDDFLLAVDNKKYFNILIFLNLE